MSKMLHHVFRRPGCHSSRQSNRRVRSWFLLRTGFLCATGAAFAPGEALAQCTGPDALPTTEFRVSQQSGRASVDLTRPHSAGHKVEIDYGDESYGGAFDKDGHAHFEFVLTEPKAEFFIVIAGSPEVTCKVEVPDFNKLYRVTLRWREPVQLDLNVIEPAHGIGDWGRVSPARLHIASPRGIGRIDLISGPPADGTTAEISYVVPDRSIFPVYAEFGYHVENVTRGLKPEAPYCDEHPLAVSQMELIILDQGAVTTRKLRTNRVRCGEVVAEARRLIAIRQ